MPDQHLLKYSATMGVGIPGCDDLDQISLIQCELRPRIKPEANIVGLYS